ncbi:MAG: tetratricopeptide repeat protein [Candidatus Thiodiazotropha sp.]
MNVALALKGHMMMFIRKSALIITLVITTTSCSTTPGDAAYRSNHPNQAADLYKKGAEQGDSLAALKLGLLISNGAVSSKNYGNAIKWFVRACELGRNAGCHNSGNAYEYGQAGAEKNYNKAHEYYTFAAEKGYMQSQYNLGSMYSNQYFKNDIEGLKWMLLANNNANKCLDKPLCQWVKNDPPGHRKKLTDRMSKEQIAKAQQRANEWKTK